MRLALALVLVSSTASAGWERETWFGTSTTSATSAQLQSGPKFVLCSAATFVRMGTAASVVATTNDIPLLAGKPFPFEVAQSGKQPKLSYLAGILASGTGRCDIWRSDGGDPAPSLGSSSSGLTDAELRATPVPVSGAFYPATQPVSAASLPLPSGASTEATLAAMAADIALIKAKTDNLDVALSTRTKPADAQAVSGTFWQATQPVSGPATDAQLRATPLPVSGTVTATPTGTQDVNCLSGCGSPAVPITYQWMTPDVVAGANKLFGDLFNASGSGRVVKVLGVYPVVKTDVGVTGVVAIRFDLYRTSAVGTGGTAAPYKSATIDVAGGNMTPMDTNNAALPAQLTARWLPTGGATISEWLSRFACFPEETNAATYNCAGQWNILDTGNQTQQPLTLREGQGLLIKQGAVASLNNIAFRVVYSLE